MLRKTMLVGVMALAAAAFAAPAARADAPLWLHGTDPITGTEELHIIGELASFVTFTSGPCAVTFVGEAENVNGMASGAITGGTIQHTCETSASGCFITPTLEGFPWSLTGVTVTEETGVEINNAKFTNHYHGTCPLPVATITIDGNATAFVEENGCLSFEDHQDDMFVHTSPLPTIPADTEANICDTTLRLG